MHPTRGQYLPEHNGKYAVKPREGADFHRAPAKGLDLGQVFCLEEERRVGNDWVVRYNNRWLQIEAGQKRAVLVRAGCRVDVRQHRDGSLTLLWTGTRFSGMNCPNARSEGTRS